MPRISTVLAASFFAVPGVAQIQIVTIPCSADVAIYAESGTVANGAGENLFVGANSFGNARRSLVRFDVAAAIPAGSIVVGGQLAATVNQGNTGAEPFAARRVLVSWNEGSSNPSGSEGQGTAAAGADVTWTLRDVAANTAWTSPGGDLAPAAASTGSLATLGGAAFDITDVAIADVHGWLAQPSSNFGWALIGNESASGSAKRLDSRSAVNASARPTLTLTYFAPGAQPVSSCPSNANSTGVPAALTSTGSTSLASNTFALSVVSVPSATNGLFFFGTRGAAPTAFGDGRLCVVAPFRRLGVVGVGPAGAASFALDFTTFPGNLIAPGTTATFQFCFRDPALGASGFNLSNGLLAPFFL